jgi:hypothetical protein
MAIILGVSMREVPIDSLSRSPTYQLDAFKLRQLDVIMQTNMAYKHC